MLFGKNRVRAFALVIFYLVSLTGCHLFTERKRKLDEIQQASPPATAQGLLQIEIDIKEKAKKVKIHVSEIPKDTYLKCHLNQKLLDQCENGSEFDLPKKDGEYVVRVTAFQGKTAVAVAESSFSIGSPSKSNLSSELKRENLIAEDSLNLKLNPNLRIDGQPFTMGMAINRERLVKIEFQLIEKPACKPIFRCVSERFDSDFESLCEQNNAKVYIPRQMPSGLQYLKVTAHCGNQSGEPLILSWYGVKSDYKPMSLQATKIQSRGHQIISLQRPEDCPENLLDFECKNPGNNTQFKSCSNVIKRYVQGMSIRAVCDGKKYDALVL